MLSPADKRALLRELSDFKQKLHSPGTPAQLRRPSAACNTCGLPADHATGLCGNRHYTPPHEPPLPATPAPPSASPHKRGVVSSTGHHAVTSPATYKDLSRSVEHKIRCYITSDLVLRLVRKRLHRNNATLADAEELVLKCGGSGEFFTRLENLGGLVNLKRLAAPYHHFTKIEGLTPLVSLTHLDLSHNRVQKVEHIQHLHHLKELVLDGNFVERLPGEAAWPKGLERLSMVGNRLSCLDDLQNLRELISLEELDLRENPICSNGQYRGIAAYAALALAVLDGVAVTDAERNAALRLWDRKGLKPLQSELVGVKREVDTLRRALEEARLQSAQTNGQLQAVARMLQMSQEDTEAAQKEKNMMEEELRLNESRLSQTQTDLLQTKSDYEFLKLELETIYPEAAKGVIERCSNTLGEDATSSVDSDMPLPSSRLPVATKKDAADAGTPALHQQFAAMLDLPLPHQVPPSHARTPVTPPPASPQGREEAAQPVSSSVLRANGVSGTTGGDMFRDRHVSPPRSRDASRAGTPAATPRGPPSASADSSAPALDPSAGRGFTKLMAKALHCEKCAVAYRAKRAAAEAKCSGEHVLGELHEAIPDFPGALGQEEVLHLAKQQLEHHKRRADSYAEKERACEASMEKYLHRATEALAQLG
eukprot:TRINITY_DN5337_c0_g2_i1.p1 TRINITY_DN5337_c0_g2~~TRINITY_DN5337_c0_g2_i1.p1  ORF type:complete len:653 (+),score=230.74 TRINITY_DN5337_c0_g2_i1:66-2024(+)